MRASIQMLLIFALILCTPCVAAPGEKKEVTDPQGRKIILQDDDNNKSKMQLFVTAYMVARFKKINTQDLILGLVSESEYSKFESDQDMGTIILVAKAEHKASVVFIIPANENKSSISAVLYEGSKASLYVDGGSVGHRTSVAEATKSLSKLPEKIPVPVDDRDQGMMCLRPGHLIADNGEKFPVYRVVYTGKPLYKWPFEKNLLRPFCLIAKLAIEPIVNTLSMTIQVHLCYQTAL